MMVESSDPTLAQGYEEARTIVRRHDPDRYIATLFAPEDKRDALFTLYAFGTEISRIRPLASEPLPGEVRLQWWRDTIEAPGAETSHPLARALLTVLEENRLPKRTLMNFIDAKVFDLYDDSMPAWRDLEGYCGETDAALIRLATLILSDGKDRDSGAACGHAGVALALTHLLRALPAHARRGQVFLPEEALKPYNIRRDDIVRGNDTPELRSVLAQVRQRVRSHVEALHEMRKTIASTVRPAFLPLASIPLYLSQMERRAYAPFGSLIEAPGWQRIWRMVRWRA